MSKKWLMWAGCGVMLLVGGYFLWSNGYRNLSGYAMLLLCPLMHLFMHQGHGHGHDHGPEQGQKADCCSGKKSDAPQESGKPACH